MGWGKSLGAGALAAWVALASACGPAQGKPEPVAKKPTGEEVEVPGDPRLPESFPRACDAIFSDDELQEFHVEIDPAEWAALQHEFANAAALQAAGTPLEQYRPLLRFEHKGKQSTGAMIRLRGNPNAWGQHGKMQFQISFNETDPEGRFRGLRKIVLDNAHYNLSYLRDRLAMSVFRDAGLPAPCVNHAKLYVNGQYYGLYANMEKIDREFLERNFPNPDGNLWKIGKELKTNGDENPDLTKNARFQKTRELGEFVSLSNVEGALLAWAVEAALPDEDGYWAGGNNYYWYEDPDRGFTYLPWDLDLGFDRLEADVDPLTWDKSQRNPAPPPEEEEPPPSEEPITPNFDRRPLVGLTFSDPALRATFVDGVERVLTLSPASTLQARIDKWAAQIAEAAEEDPSSPWNFERHQDAVWRLRQYMSTRANRLNGWLECVRENDHDSAGCM